MMLKIFRPSYIPEEADEEVAGPALETADVDGLRIRYLRRGEGAESAILIHGFGGDLNIMDVQPREPWPREILSMLWICPGMGARRNRWEMEALRGSPRSWKASLTRSERSKAHLVGHSMGGAVAAMFALNHPERCLSLTLIASAGLGPEIDGEYIRGFVSATRRNELRPQLEKLFADSRLITRQLVDDTLKYKRLDGVEPALRTIASQLCPADRQGVILREQIIQLKMPVLVLWGSEDRIIPASHAHESAPACSNGNPPGPRSYGADGGRVDG